jgi:hypothetical protein
MPHTEEEGHENSKLGSVTRVTVILVDAPKRDLSRVNEQSGCEFFLAEPLRLRRALTRHPASRRQRHPTLAGL